MGRALAVAGLAILLGAALAPAADRYVSILGDDAGNDCLSGAGPCRSLVHALAQATSGDVIKAAQGPYVEEIVIDTSITLMLSGGGHPTSPAAAQWGIRAFSRATREPATPC